MSSSIIIGAIDRGERGLVCNLKKSLYRQKQPLRTGFEKFSSGFHQYDMTISSINCLPSNFSVRKMFTF